MAREKRSYTIEQKYRTALLWFVYRSWGKVARKTGIPATTIRSWSNQEWWEEMILDCRKKYQAKYDATMTQVLDLVGRKILDQVKNGIVHKKVLSSGEIVEYRVDVQPRDLSGLIRESTNSLQLLRGLPTSRSERVTKGDVKDKLKEIQQGLETFNKVDPVKEKNEDKSVH